MRSAVLPSRPPARKSRLPKGVQPAAINLALLTGVKSNDIVTVQALFPLVPAIENVTELSDWRSSARA